MRVFETRGSEPHEPAAPRPVLRGLVLLDDSVDTLAPGRVQDPSLAEPEGDVVGAFGVAVGDEVAPARLRHVRARLLLLVCVAWNDVAAAPVGHMDESGAVDPALRHPAPEIRRAEIGAGVAHRVPAIE